MSNVRSTTARPIEDGSGLIDLNALAGGPLHVSEHIPVLPFGPPELPVVPQAPPAPQVRTPSNARAAATGVAIAVLGLAVAGLLNTRMERSAWATSGLAGAARDLPARVAVQKEKPTQADPVPEATPPQDAPRAPVVQPRGNLVGGTRTGQEKTAPVKDDKKPPPAASPCNGDLMCEMRRSTHG